MMRIHDSLGFDVEVAASFNCGFKPFVSARAHCHLKPILWPPTLKERLRVVGFMKRMEETISVSRGTTMKMSHQLRSDAAGPVWGLIMGMFLMLVGIGLWIYGKSPQPGSRLDESLAMTAMLIGAFLAVYAGREITHRHR
jgi:hypothetical protein